jgi:hypothetical protein
MSEDWRREYLALKDFLAGHPEIVITRESVLTPAESRALFYSLFSKTLAALTAQFFPEMSEDCAELSEAYKASAAEIGGSFNIDNNRALAEFYKFLDEPADTVANAAFNDLFDLLQGKVSEDVFQEAAKSNISTLARGLRATVYEKWILLSLVMLLVTQEIYDCSPLRRINFRRQKFVRLDHEILAKTSTPVKTNTLSWEFDPEPTLTQPDFILRASQGGISKYVSVRTNFRMGTNRAKNFPDWGEWVNVPESFQLGSDVMLIYTSPNLTDLVLVSERGRICRPEVVIKYLEDSEGYSGQWLEAARIEDAILQPNSGFYLVTRPPLTLPGQEKLGEYMHLLELGFDQSKLVGIVDALLASEGPMDTVNTASSVI